MLGRPVKTGPRIVVETDLTRALKGLFETHEEKTTFQDDDKALAAYTSVAASSMSKFPLPHYLLARMLFKRANPDWRKYATTAREMIYKVTLVPEHHGWYDHALKELEKIT
jgi:hypothetical protein